MNTVLTNYDGVRRSRSINALLKAKEKLEIERLYLTINGPQDQMYVVLDALDHVTNALERLQEGR